MSKRYEKYELVRDLPDADAGTILEWDGGDHYDYKSKRNFDDDTTLSWYRKEFVENNPAWFKPIEDKEPTAFQNEDDRIHDFRFAEWASHSDWTFVWSKQKWYNEEDEQNITPLTTQELFKKFKQGSLSQSIPAGTGTANETINEGRGEYPDKWDIRTQPLKSFPAAEMKTTLCDNPVLDRQDKKERIEVAALIKFETMKDGVQYLLGMSQAVPPEKYDVIKRAIEQVINS